MAQTVFRGPNAVAAFLNPDNHVPPLVEIPARLNPFYDQGVCIFAKLMAFLPLGNVKSLAAYSMLEQAHAHGDLDGIRTLVESSSGNTVFSLAAIARAVYGIDRTVALASHEVEPGKLRLLRLFGTEIEIMEEDICPDPNDPMSSINQAKSFWKDVDHRHKIVSFNPGQYENEANPAAHMRWTGPQLWEQTEGKLTVVATGLGTTGTLVGTSTYLKGHSSMIKSVGVIRLPNNPVPGVRTEGLLKEIGFPWRDHIDALVSVGTADAYRSSMYLCREGLMAGPSSGFAYRGLIEYLTSMVASEQLDSLRNEEGEIVAVFIAPDSPLPYLEEYERYVDTESFPPIRCAELLKHPMQETAFESFPNHGDVRDVRIPIEEFYRLAYRLPPEELEDRIAHDGLDEGAHLCSYQVLDMRTRREFDDHHLPGALRIDPKVFHDHLESIFVPKLKEKGPVVLVCETGAKSTVLALAARATGLLYVQSLEGGMMEWSRRNLPRIRPKGCGPVCDQ